MSLLNQLFFLLALFGMQACGQQGKSTDPDETVSPQPEYGAFEDYAFVLDGEIIEQQMLVDHLGAILTAIFPYQITWDHRDYHGAVYFSQEEPVSSIANADSPAYFIGGTQVSPYNIRLLASDAYHKIEKSTADTTIKGTRYRGSINFLTNADFFAEHSALPALLQRYTGLPPDQVIVHWRGPHYSSTSGIGTVIDSDFSIYYIDPDDLQSVEINCIQFAEGDRYVVEFVDRQYNRWGLAGEYEKGRKGDLTNIQRIPYGLLAKDVTCPCCVADVDVTSSAVFTRPEISPTPLQGEEVYLRKLSNIMGLPVEKPTALVSQDSITVQFMVTKTGMLATLESVGTDKPGHIDVLNAIRWHSCAWSTGIMSGIPVLTKRKMTIFYSKDERGEIQSLDRLAYRPYLY